MVLLILLLSILSSKIIDARIHSPEMLKRIEESGRRRAQLRAEYETELMAAPSNQSLPHVNVNITNRSDKIASFVLSAIHTTQEKTNMYSKKYNAYLTQSVVTDPVEAGPSETARIELTGAGQQLMKANKIFGLVVFAAQVESVIKDIRKERSQNQIVVRVYEDELKVTEYIDTYMSNPKTKQITLKTAQNFFDFPQDFIFNAKTEREYIIPNAEKIIEDMRAVEKKYNKAIFPPHYFKKEVIEGLPEKELSKLGSYVAKLLREPIPIKLATLGTLLDCGKYNGIAAALVKIALAIVTLVVTGGAASFIMDAVDSGMNFSKEIKDAKMRG